mmetsp:Transcript_4026/g.7734  ORF Transcript_4026/g.7734 Transcript_4026/m.7734 type:complete len:506 (+) Transcript_4026:36-1553(+)|eukprot:CAMPEP_0175096586 /NCGR_PEP_ID=MMETSP0086_2-20121207/4812_1 /TAXON_ID=136419 /ORGANISM="Unknown Unknown, Strain D1" /LENGTH=505 /DNA_ID=CAMNT_0016369999 /DNA_START=31 /DNA_END=1548 /DNA_ORIENTATION=-
MAISKAILLLLVAATVVAARDTVWPSPRQFLPSLRWAQEAAPQGYPVPEEHYFQQRLDHFNDSVTTTWPHRYLVNRDKWDGRGALKNGCPGPILLYTGNEGPIDAFWGITGFVVETLASKLGGLVLFSEQRFYGKSWPLGVGSHSHQYLTTAQVVADHAAVAQHIKSTLPKAQNCPVVAFGGSYGGTLTALIRAQYPDIVVGGLAASSELGYYDEANWESHNVTEFTFEDTVTRTWAESNPKCLDAVDQTLSAIDSAAPDQVVKSFGLCSAKVLGPGPASTFFAYVLEGMPQGDYASAGNPVTTACDLLITTAASSPSKLLDAAATVVKGFYGSPACIPYDVGGPGNTPGDGPGISSSWGFQSCSETLHSFSARGFRRYNFDLANSTALCQSLYPNNPRAVPNLHAITDTFGSPYAMAEGRPTSKGKTVTRLIWSQGTLDPWHGWFQNIATPPSNLDVHHILIEGGAHHEDLRADFTGDKASVVAAREQEAQIIQRWIADASSTG